jgi:hypothetical protein
MLPQILHPRVILKEAFFVSAEVTDQLPQINLMSRETYVFMLVPRVSVGQKFHP